MRGAASWPLPVTEAYIRGNDLVASYQPSSDWPFSPQIYWRANGLQSVAGVLASMSLLVSVQTHLLDTFPQIGVRSQLPIGEMLLISVRDTPRSRVEVINRDRTFTPTGELCCVVARLNDWPFSYAEIMRSSDFHEVTLSPGAGGILIDWHLFADFLEKGVIRRARLHAAVLPRENDIELATACCEATQHLDLPLTT